MSSTEGNQDPPSVAERALDRFRAGLAPRLPLRAALAQELAEEARPAIYALIFATSNEHADDPESLEHHETLAMATLLGRKLALLGGTPTAALRLAPALLASVRAEDWDVPTSLDEPLVTVLMEGYVRGREERLLADAARDAVERLPVVVLAPGCFAVFPRGTYDSELVERAMEELGRRLFREEALACVVGLDGLGEPSPGVARALVSLDTAARTVGVAPIYAGMTDAFRAACDRAGTQIGHLELADDTAEAVRRALGIAGYAVRRASWLPAPVRRWMARGR